MPFRSPALCAAMKPSSKLKPRKPEAAAAKPEAAAAAASSDDKLQINHNKDADKLEVKSEPAEEDVQSDKLRVKRRVMEILSEKGQDSVQCRSAGQSTISQSLASGQRIRCFDFGPRLCSVLQQQQRIRGRQVVHTPASRRPSLQQKAHVRYFPNALAFQQCMQPLDPRPDNCKPGPPFKSAESPGEHPRSIEVP